MITPRKNRQLPDTLQLNLTLIDAFDTDNISLQERREAFVKAVHYVMLERPQLEALFKSGRIETMTTTERDTLVELLNEKGREIDSHNIEQARVLNGINSANRQQAEAKTRLDVLKEPPQRSRLSDKQWLQYQNELAEAGEESKLADRAAANALAKLPAWENEHRQLKLQYAAIEQRINLCDYDRGCLDGSINPNDPQKRIHDVGTGLQVRGPGSGFIRTSQ